MKIFSVLWIGDVFGSVGRKTLIKHLQLLKMEKFDLIIANVENATHGSAINEKHSRHLKNEGVHIMTHGNHLPDFQSELNQEFLKENTLIPANLDPFPTGWMGTKTFLHENLKIQVTNLLGQTFIRNQTTNPFQKLLEIVQKSDADFHFVDFHAETTAEKIALGWAFDGQLTALAGTHTHVQTSDARILPKGTFFITDIGMTGPHLSIIGAEPDGIIAKNFNQKGYIRPSQSFGQFSAVKIKIDLNSKKIIDFDTIFLINKNSKP